MGPRPSGWGLGVRLTTPPHKKLPVRKPEMWSRKGLEEVHYGDEGPYSALVPVKKKKNATTKPPMKTCSRFLNWNVISDVVFISSPLVGSTGLLVCLHLKPALPNSPSSYRHRVLGLPTLLLPYNLQSSEISGFR